jgi:DNA-binding GntR family transcriptional regulator
MLRGQIEDGTLSSRVPSVKTLTQERGISHITAEKALSVLKDEGIILSVIGKGTFVVKRSATSSTTLAKIREWLKSLRVIS